MTLDYDALSQAGTMIGSAAVIVMDDRCCMVQLGVRVSQFYEHESCGKCTPCRVGTRWLTQILKKIEAGQGTHADLDLLLDVGERINGTCLCPLGDSDAIAVASYVAKFREEFLAHIEEGGCPFHGQSSLEGIVAPTDVHEAHVGPAGVPRPLEGRRVNKPWTRSSATRWLRRRSRRVQACAPPAGRESSRRIRLLPHPARREAMTELIKVTIDDREVEVEKGTGLVETAASAGIEIPVFCEPRLGPPSAPAGCASSRSRDCRSCRRAARSRPRRDGRAHRRDVGARRRRAAGDLEFILVNHPLDCPVCDKGGECPLRDLTFRYGPGSTRMRFPKMTFDKPVPSRR